jgi:hypothetical protein
LFGGRAVAAAESRKTATQSAPPAIDRHCPPYAGDTTEKFSNDGSMLAKAFGPEEVTTMSRVIVLLCAVGSATLPPDVDGDVTVVENGSTAACGGAAAANWTSVGRVIVLVPGVV